VPPLHTGEDGATPGLPPVPWWGCASEQSVARDGPCAGEGLDEGCQLSGERHHHLVGLLPPRRAVSATLAQAPWGWPADRLEGLWEGFQLPWEMAADLGRIPGGLRPLDECPPGDRVAVLGAGALAAAFATGGLTGWKSQIAHERSGVLETGQVAACGDAHDRHGAWDTTPRLETLDDGG